MTDHCESLPVRPVQSAPDSHIGSFDTPETLLKYYGHSTSRERGLDDDDFHNLTEYILPL